MSPSLAGFIILNGEPMYDYPVTLHTDENPGIAITSRDLPELNSFGDTLEEALREAVDGIESVLSFYVDHRLPIPKASVAESGEQLVRLPIVTVSKIILWNTMMEKGMRKADLCRLLNAKPVAVDRLVDFLHTSKIDQIEMALAALGKRIQVVEAA